MDFMQNEKVNIHYRSFLPPFNSVDHSFAAVSTYSNGQHDRYMQHTVTFMRGGGGQNFPSHNCHDCPLHKLADIEEMQGTSKMFE